MASMKSKQKKAGRPHLPPEKGKRQTIGLRVTSELKDRLLRKAAKTGRSLSQEAELRLERSFEEEKKRYEIFGGEDRYTLMQWLAMTITLAEGTTGKHWKSDRETYLIALHAMDSILGRAIPEKHSPLKDVESPDEVAKKLGKSLADQMIELGTKKKAAKKGAQSKSGE